MSSNTLMALDRVPPRYSQLQSTVKFGGHLGGLSTSQTFPTRSEVTVTGIVVQKVRSDGDGHSCTVHMKIMISIQQQGKYQLLHQAKV